VDPKILQFGVYFNLQQFLKIFASHQAYQEFQNINANVIIEQLKSKCPNFIDKPKHTWSLSDQQEQTKKCKEFVQQHLATNPNFLCNILQALLQSLKIMKSYQLTGFLGSGVYGMTFLLQNENGEQKAIKVLTPSKHQRGVLSGKEELMIADNVNQFLGIAPRIFAYEKLKIAQFFTDTIVQEKLDVSCLTYLMCLQRMTNPAQQKELLNKFFVGMNYLFLTLLSAHMVHGDCHMGNVMFVYHPEYRFLMPKLIDFGYFGCNVVPEHPNWWIYRIFDIAKFATVTGPLPVEMKKLIIPYFSHLAFLLFPDHSFFQNKYRLLTYDFAWNVLGKHYGTIGTRQRIGCSNFDWSNVLLDEPRKKYILTKSLQLHKKILNVMNDDKSFVIS
jgi:hypothetical protein